MLLNFVISLCGIESCAFIKTTLYFPDFQTVLGLDEANSAGQFADSHLMCRFRRQRSVAQNEKEAAKVFPLADDDKYYLLLPVGPATEQGTDLYSEYSTLKSCFSLDATCYTSPTLCKVIILK